MSATRDVPYGAFNFLVDLGGGGSPASPDAGFEECGPLAERIDVVEYRNGNDARAEPHRITGLARTEDVTLKRGVIGSQTLYAWFDQVRTGDVAALRTVSITLMAEDHQTPVLTWILAGARPVRYSVAPLDARSSRVAIEELTLAFESLRVQPAASG